MRPMLSQSSLFFHSIIGYSPRPFYLIKMSSYCCLMLAVAAVVVGINGQATVITVTNGEADVGSRWGPLESCPSGSRVVSYQTRNEVDAPVVDDAALHTILLFCDDPLETNFTSTPGL